MNNEQRDDVSALIHKDVWLGFGRSQLAREERAEMMIGGDDIRT